ncbi:MAG: EamA family transporter [Acidobacteria bacterium]|nr:EamA family transporter [Acidobacteriota bacterium]MBK7599201.1 EamA family transporter [Acidobacteriota bacterium]MBK8313913.1 EamA family transporter [Acidobacteriota bacterium]MBK9706337.1 EamA family transporter [Acidobacteriota bacterium]
MKTLFVLFIAICAQTLGDVCLTKGMRSVGEVDTIDPVQLFHIGVQVFSNPLIWGGIFILSIFFGLYLVALSWADLSFVLPVTAFGYVLNAFMSWKLLGEHVSIVRWIGTLIICVGVAVVSNTEQRTTRQDEIDIDAGVKAA